MEQPKPQAGPQRHDVQMMNLEDSDDPAAKELLEIRRKNRQAQRDAAEKSQARVIHLTEEERAELRAARAEADRKEKQKNWEAESRQPKVLIDAEKFEEAEDAARKKKEEAETKKRVEEKNLSLVRRAIRAFGIRR